MHKLYSVLLFAAIFSLAAVAQESTSATGQGAPTSGAASAASSSQQDSSDAKAAAKKEKQDKKDKKKKEKQAKKDKKSGAQDTIEPQTSQVFSERTANDVLGMIRDGLEGHSQRLLLSAFDSDKMDGYLSFEDQIDAFFRRYEAFRVHFRIANVTIEGTKGVVLVDSEIEEIPQSGGAPQRKRGQLRFELEQGRKGWRVVDFRDRGFFS